MKIALSIHKNDYLSHSTSSIADRARGEEAGKASCKIYSIHRWFFFHKELVVMFFFLSSKVREAAFLFMPRPDIHS